MPWPARPTQRCLREDLGSHWDEPGQHRAAVLGDFPTDPLHECAHPIVRHAAAKFTGATADDDVRHETISAVTATPLWKIKSGRWRGGIWVDPDDQQAWLCAAGLRREGDTADFYADFPTKVDERGIEPFLPTVDDRNRLKLEQASVRIAEWRALTHTEAVAALRAATDAGSSTFESRGLEAADPICTVEVHQERIEDDDPSGGMVEVTVTVKVLDWAQADRVEVIELDALVALNPDEQAWTHSGAGEGGSVSSFLTSGVEFDGLLAEAPRRIPGQSFPGHAAHYTHRADLTRSIVEGEPVKALCGRFFVPRQDPVSLPVCGVCGALYRQVQ